MMCFSVFPQSTFRAKFLANLIEPSLIFIYFYLNLGNRGLHSKDADESDGEHSGAVPRPDDLQTGTR
jgi:hypothetical protein